MHPPGTPPAWVLLPEEARKVLGGLRLRPRILAEGRISGLHPSSHQGQSLEFADLKGYAFGDDTGGIDWKVFARTDKLYVRRYLDETNLTAWMVLDASGSMAYPAPVSKFRHAAMMLAGFAYVLLNQGDEVGLTLAFEDGARLCPPRGVPSHLADMLYMMSDATPGGGTALAEAVAEVSGMAKKKGMVMVASDLITGWEAVVGLLGVLASRGHAVLVLHTLSTEELTFPFSGSVVFRSEETGESALLDARGLKKRYLAAVNGFLAAVRRACHEAGVFYFQVDVNNPPHVGVAEAMRGF